MTHCMMLETRLGNADAKLAALAIPPSAKPVTLPAYPWKETEQ